MLTETEYRCYCDFILIAEQFPKPNITLQHSFLDAGKCVISLKCSSLSSNISLMWTSEERLWSDSANVTKESVTWTSSLNREAKFFCIATDGNRNMSNQLSVKCPGMYSTKPLKI